MMSAWVQVHAYDSLKLRSPNEREVASIIEVCPYERTGR